MNENEKEMSLNSEQRKDIMTKSSSILKGFEGYVLTRETMSEILSEMRGMLETIR